MYEAIVRKNRDPALLEWLGTGLFRTVYFLPVVSSAVAVGLVWSWIYAKDAGLLNYMITNLGGEPVNWLSTRNALYSYARRCSEGIHVSTQSCCQRLNATMTRFNSPSRSSGS